MIYPNKLSKREVYEAIKFELDFPVLVRTAQGETRGGTHRNAMNIMHTILNRVQKQRDQWGMNVNEVCLKANSKGVHQYSYWDKTDIEFLSYYYVERLIPPTYDTIRNWSNGLDYVKGATHYHTHGTHPDWSVGKKPVYFDDMHKFYEVY
jgi:hypothetical protein